MNTKKMLLGNALSEMRGRDCLGSLAFVADCRVGRQEITKNLQCHIKWFSF